VFFGILASQFSRMTTILRKDHLMVNTLMVQRSINLLGQPFLVPSAGLGVDDEYNTCLFIHNLSANIQIIVENVGKK
jgi:hypothetical protein